MRLKQIKRELSMIMVVALLLSTVFGTGGAALAAVPTENGNAAVSGAAVSFPDISGSYAKSEIEALAARGILSGYGDGSFGPEKEMTRAEFAKVLTLSAGLKEDLSVADKFRDIAPDAWYKGHVGALVKAGITSGTSAATFSPDDPVTREQLAVFFVRALGLEETAKNARYTKTIADLDEVSVWAQAAVRLAFEIGFLQGTPGADGTVRFLPHQNAERQALARLAYEFVVHKDAYLDEADKIREAVPSATPSSSATPTPTPTGQVVVPPVFLPPGNTGSNPNPAPAPEVVGAVSVGTDRVEVEFSQTVTAPSAADFTFDQGLSVSEASLKPGNGKVVVLKTSVQAVGTAYMLSYKGASTGKSITGSVTVLTSIDQGVYTGNYRVARGIVGFGPSTGTAVIHGTLQLDPGSDGEMELQNVEASNIEVLSGASNSIMFKNIKVTVKLKINTANQTNSVRIVSLGGTAVARTSVESKVILDSQAGTLGNIDLTSGAAGNKVELRGNFDGKVSVDAEGVTLAVGTGATVNQIDISKKATIDSKGSIANVEVAAPVTLQGVVNGTVKVVADDANLEIAANSTVSKVDMAAKSKLTSRGSVQEVAITAPVQVELDGDIGGKVTIQANDAKLSVGEYASVGAVELQASATVEANGSIQSMEIKGDYIAVKLDGTRKGDAMDRTVTAAVYAIRDLPDPVQLSDRALVKSTRGKVKAAAALGSQTVIPDMSKLEAAEAGIKQLAREDAELKLAALPADASAIGLAESEAAAVKLSLASEAVLLAKIEGNVEQELGGYGRLTLVQARLAALKAVADAIVAANTALAEVPQAESVNLDGLHNAIAKASMAEKAYNAAMALTAPAEYIVGLENLAQVKAKITQLQDQLSDRAQAVNRINGAILQLPAAASITYSENHRSLVAGARDLVHTGKAQFQLSDEELPTLHLLTAAEVKLLQLEGQKNDAVRSAFEAVQALPAASTVQFTDKPAITQAQLKVEAALRAGAVESEITNLAVLKEAADKIGVIERENQLAVTNALEAIEALPALEKISKADIPAVNAASELVELIRSRGLNVGEVVKNLLKLEEAKKRLSQELLDAVQAAETAIGGLPAVEQLKLAHSADVAISRSKANAVADRGSPLSLIGNYSVLLNAEAKINELGVIKAHAIAAAIQAIGGLPAASEVKSSDSAAIASARSKVSEALAREAVLSEITNLSKLEAVEAAYNGLEVAAAPTFKTGIYEGSLAAYGYAEPGGMLEVQIGGETKRYGVSKRESGYFFFYDEGVHVTAGQVITVVSSVYNKKPSQPVQITVQAVAGLTEAPATVTDQVYAGDWVLNGKVQTNTYVRLTTLDGQVLSDMFPYREDGSTETVSFWMHINRPEGLPEGQVRLQAITFGKAASVPVIVNVHGVSGTTNPPMVETVFEMDRNLRGRTDPNALLKVEDGLGQSIATSRANSEGFFWIEWSNDRIVSAGDQFKVSAKAPGKAASEPVQVSVAAVIGQTQQPTVTGAVYEGFLVIQGKVEPGADIQVEGVQLTYRDINMEGYFWVGAMTRFAEGDSVKLTSQVRGKRISEPLTVTVVKGVPTPKPAYVRDVYEGDYSLMVEAQKNQIVAMVKPTGETVGWAKMGSSYGGVISMHIRKELLHAGDTVWVIAMSQGYAASQAVEMVVKPVSGQTGQPVTSAEVYLSDNITISGTAEPKSDVMVYWNEGRNSTTTRSNDQGKFDFWIGHDFAEGDKLYMVAKAPGKAASTPIELTVRVPSEQTAAPELTESVYPGDTRILGKAEPSAMITVKRANGQTISRNGARNDGTFEAYLYSEVVLEPNEILSVTAGVTGKKESLPVTVQVKQPTVQTAVPKLYGPLFESSMFLEGAAEPGSTVRLLNQAGAIIAQTTAWAGDSTSGGKFYLDLLSWNRTIQADETLKLIATARGKLTSETDAVRVLPVSGVTNLHSVTGAVYEISVSLKGQTEPYAYVALTRNGSTTWTRAYADGYFNLNSDGGTYPIGEQVQVIAVADGKGRSGPVWFTVLPVSGKTLAPTVTETVYVYEDGYRIPILTGEPSALEIRNQDGVILDKTGLVYGPYTLTRYDANLVPGTELLITARAPGKQASDPVRFQVKPLNGITQAPTVTDSVYLYEDGFVIHGYAEPGAWIELRGTDGTLLQKIYLGDRYFRLERMDVQIPAGSEVLLTAKAFGKQRSAPVTLTVKPADGLTPPPQVEATVIEEDTRISVYNPVSGKLSITREDGTELYNGFIGSGYYEIPLPNETVLAPGNVLLLRADTYGKLPSNPVRVTVTAATYQTVTPAVYGEVYAGGGGNLPVAVERGSYLTVKKQDGSLVYSSWMYNDGISAVWIGSNLAAGETLMFTSKASGKKTSEPVSITVIDPIGESQAPYIRAKLYEDDKSLAGIAAPRSKVTVYTAEGVPLGSVLAEFDGRFSLRLQQQVQTSVVVTAQEYGKQASAELTVPVVPVYEITEKPTIRFVHLNQLQGFAEPGAAVKVQGTLGNNWYGTAGLDGLFNLSVNFKAGDTIQVTAKAPGKKVSSAVNAPVPAVSTMPAPYVRGDVYTEVGSLRIAGKANSNIEVTDEKGIIVGSSYIPYDAGYTTMGLYTYPYQLMEGTRLTVTSRVYDYMGAGWTVSDAVYVTVKSGAPQSAAPELTGIHYGTLIGKAEPGASVKIIPIGTDTIFYGATADINGRFEMDISSLPYRTYQWSAYTPGKKQSEITSFTYEAPAVITAQPQLIGKLTEASPLLSGLAELDSFIEVRNREGMIVGTTTAYDGMFNLSLYSEYVIGGEALLVTARARGKATSLPASITVELPVELTRTPTVTGTVYEDSSIRGTAESNARVWIEDSQGNAISGTYYSYYNGNFEISPSSGLMAGDTFYVYSKVRGKQKSEPVALPIASYGMRTVSASVYGAVYEEDAFIRVYLTGTGYYNYTQVIVKDESGVTRGSGSGYYGMYDISLHESKPLKPNEKLFIYTKTYGRDTSLPTTVTVEALTEQTDTPTVTRSVYVGDVGFRITVEPAASKLQVRHAESTSQIYPDRYDSGAYIMYLPDYVKAGDSLVITAKAPFKKTSEALILKVLPTAGRSDTPTVTDNVYTDFTWIRGMAEPGAAVRVTTAVYGTRYTSPWIPVVSNNGEFELSLSSYSPYSMLPAGSAIELTAKAIGKNISDPVRLTVLEAPSQTLQPKVNPVYEGDSYISGYAQNYATVTVTRENGTISGYTHWNNIGKFEYYVGGPLLAGERLTVTSMVYGRTVSEAVYVQVLPLSGFTTITSVEADGIDRFVIQTEPNATVSMNLGTVNGYHMDKADLNGRAIMEISGGELRSGKTVTFTATARGKLTSEPTALVLPLAAVTERPTVTSSVYGYYGYFNIQGNAPAGSWIGVYQGDKLITTSTSNSYNGTFNVYQYYYLQSGEQLKIVARQSGKSASEPVYVTLSGGSYPY